VPQIWLTYNELGDLIGSDAATARAAAHVIPLDRRKSHDGHTRVKLNARLAEMFLDQVTRHWIDHNMGICVDELRDVRERMMPTHVATHRIPSATAS
jgi:hypothetical protein